MKIDVYDLRFQGWAASVFFHVLLLAFFLVIVIRVEAWVEEYSEVMLFDLSSAQASRLDEVAAGFPVATSREQTDPAAVVRLPERRPISVRPEDLAVAAVRREAQVPHMEPSRLLSELERAGQERLPTAHQGGATGDKQSPAEPGLREGLLLPDVDPSAAGIGPDLPYLIEWIGQSREIVRSILPEYPEGVERDVELLFRFSVTPAGDVTAVRPLQKGEPILEEAAITALRQWRFQPLPKESPQANQEAVITFKFIIRL